MICSLQYLHQMSFHVLMSVFLCPQDPAVATSKRSGNTSYESYDRGTAKNAWVTESDGKTPLLGEVSSIWPPNYKLISFQPKNVTHLDGSTFYVQYVP